MAQRWEHCNIEDESEFSRGFKKCLSYFHKVTLSPFTHFSLKQSVFITFPFGKSNHEFWRLCEFVSSYLFLFSYHFQSQGIKREGLNASSTLPTQKVSFC